LKRFYAHFEIRIVADRLIKHVLDIEPGIIFREHLVIASRLRVSLHATAVPGYAFANTEAGRQ